MAPKATRRFGSAPCPHQLSSSRSRPYLAASRSASTPRRSASSRRRRAPARSSASSTRSASISAHALRVSKSVSCRIKPGSISFITSPPFRCETQRVPPTGLVIAPTAALARHPSRRARTDRSPKPGTCTSPTAAHPPGPGHHQPGPHPGSRNRHTKTGPGSSPITTGDHSSALGTSGTGIKASEFVADRAPKPHRLAITRHEIEQGPILRKPHRSSSHPGSPPRLKIGADVGTDTPLAIHQPVDIHTPPARNHLGPFIEPGHHVARRTRRFSSSVDTRTTSRSSHHDHPPSNDTVAIVTLDTSIAAINSNGACHDVDFSLRWNTPIPSHGVVGWIHPGTKGFPGPSGPWVELSMRDANTHQGLPRLTNRLELVSSDHQRRRQPKQHIRTGRNQRQPSSRPGHTHAAIDHIDASIGIQSKRHHHTAFRSR